MKTAKKIALSVLAITAILILWDTVYGHTHKREIVERALNFEIPSNCEFVDYYYFLKDVETTIVFPTEKEYDAVFDGIWGPSILCVVSELDEEVVNEMDLNFLDGKNVITALKFYSDLPPENVCGVLFKMEKGSALYISKPIPAGFQVDDEWGALWRYSKS